MLSHVCLSLRMYACHFASLHVPSPPVSSCCSIYKPVSSSHFPVVHLRLHWTLILLCPATHIGSHRIIPFPVVFHDIHLEHECPSRVASLHFTSFRFTARHSTSLHFTSGPIPGLTFQIWKAWSVQLARFSMIFEFAVLQHFLNCVCQCPKSVHRPSHLIDDRARHAHLTCTPATRHARSTHSAYLAPSALRTNIMRPTSKCIQASLPCSQLQRPLERSNPREHAISAPVWPRDLPGNLMTLRLRLGCVNTTESMH